MGPSENKMRAFAAEGPKTQSVASPRRKLAPLRAPLVFAGLFLLAFVGSQWARHRWQSGPTGVVPPSSDTSHAPDEKPAKAETSVEALARADRALREHRFARALALYVEFLNGTPGNSAEIEVRLGLCQEGLGNTDRAVTHFRKAIGAFPNRSNCLAAHLGIARCLLRNQHPLEARQQLYPFLLDDTRVRDVPAVLVSEMRYLIALARAREGTMTETEPLPLDGILPAASVGLDTPIFLEEVALPMSPALEGKSPVPLPVPMAVQKGNAGQAAKVLAIDRTVAPASELLDELAQSADLKSYWTQPAQAALANRSLRLSFRDRPMQEVLEEAADSLGIVCRVEKDKVQFTTISEVSGLVRDTHCDELAKRALERALDADMTHPWAPGALMELGNLAARSKKWRDAISCYQESIRVAPHSAFSVFAYFNLAQIHLQRNEFVEARKAFFRVTDQNPGHELAMRAGLRLGLLCLEDEDTREALIHLRRANTIAMHSPYRPIVRMALAAAYLQHGDPESARTVLAQAREILQKEPYHATAAFLDSYARYRIARNSKNTGQIRREGNDLVNTLWHDKSQPILGVYGQWLMAQAYRDLGFLDAAQRQLTVAREAARGPFKWCVENTLAEVLAQQEQFEEATVIFEELAETESRFRGGAKYQLARIALIEGRYDLCTARCRQLWNEKAYPDTGALLHLWGAALDARGEYAKAAQCFAGKAPE